MTSVRPVSAAPRDEVPAARQDRGSRDLFAGLLTVAGGSTGCVVRPGRTADHDRDHHEVEDARPTRASSHHDRRDAADAADAGRVDATRTGSHHTHHDAADQDRGGRAADAGDAVDATDAPAGTPAPVVVPPVLDVEAALNGALAAGRVALPADAGVPRPGVGTPGGPVTEPATGAATGGTPGAATGVPGRPFTGPLGLGGSPLTVTRPADATTPATTPATAAPAPATGAAAPAAGPAVGAQGGTGGAAPAGQDQAAGTAGPAVDGPATQQATDVPAQGAPRTGIHDQPTGAAGTGRKTRAAEPTAAHTVTTAATADGAHEPATATSGTAQDASAGTTQAGQPAGHPGGEPGQHAGQHGQHGDRRERGHDEAVTPSLSTTLPPTTSATASAASGPAEPAPAIPVAGPAPTTAVAAPVTGAALPTAAAGPSAGHVAAPAAGVTGQVLPEVARLVTRGDGTQRVTVKLAPEALGEVRIVLTVRRGEVHVRMSGSQAAQQALLQGQSDLHRLLADTGATTTSVQVGDAAATRGAGSDSSHGDRPATGDRDGSTASSGQSDVRRDGAGQNGPGTDGRAAAGDRNGSGPRPAVQPTERTAATRGAGTATPQDPSRRQWSRLDVSV